MAKEIENIMALCADIVEKAKSGHPGAPLGLSQFIHILYTEYLNLNPADPLWIHRDIFILSNGHACAIQYLMNYLIGFLPMEELQRFRQLNSMTPGHPERNSHGIEISTGPLGQGVAASVGFAISCKILQRYGLRNMVYCVFGDGCYSEGISQEAFSLCSRLGLDNITFIYDFNYTTIDGSTELSMCEDVVGRFKCLNFDVFEISDDGDEIRRALDTAVSRTKLIVLHTKIGKDSNVEGSCKAHGNPLGEDEVRRLKQKLGMPPSDFHVTEDLRKAYDKAVERMRKHVAAVSPLEGAPGYLSEIINGLMCQQPVEYWGKYETEYKSEELATRIHLSNALQALRTNAHLLCGCADLTPSVKGQLSGTEDMAPGRITEKTYIRYGIREHGMCGVMNGIAAHGVFRPIGGTFLNFAAYGMPSIKIACLDRLRTIYLFTHDSIGLGEDGPTHQPIEVLATLRALPNLTTFRPCDGRETRSALAQAIARNGPCAIVLTRQKVCEQPENPDVTRGGYYVVREPGHEIVLIATGSEVGLAMDVKKQLRHRKVSVVSMLSMEVFEEQPEEYKQDVVDRKAVRVSIEALGTFGWTKYSDFQIGLDEFGRSAPSKDVFEFFGFTPEAVSGRIEVFMKSKK